MVEVMTSFGRNRAVRIAIGFALTLVFLITLQTIPSQIKKYYVTQQEESDDSLPELEIHDNTLNLLADEAQPVMEEEIKLALDSEDQPGLSLTHQFEEETLDDLRSQ